MMSPQEIVVFAVILLNTPLGLGVWLTNPRLAANRQFFLLCVNLSVWLASLFFAFRAQTPDSAIFWIRASLATGVWVPISAILLFRGVETRNWSFLRLAKSQAPFIAAAAAVSILSLTPWILNEVVMPRATGEIPEAKFSDLILALTIYHVLMIFFVVRGNLGVIRRTTEVQRLEAQYVMTGICMMYVSGVFFSLILPVVTGNSQVVVLAPFAVLVLNGVIAFGIATRRLLSVSVVVRQFTSYALLAVALAAIYGVSWTVGGKLSELMSLDEVHLPHLFAAVTTLLAYSQLHALLRKFVEDVFLHLVRGMKFDSKRLLKKADAELSAVRTNEDLFQRFKGFLSEAAGTDEIDFHLVDDVRSGARGKNGNGKLNLKEINSFLRDEPWPVVLSLVPRMNASDGLKEAALQLKDKGYSVAVGVQSNHRFHGSILLGRRLYGRAYEEDRLEAMQMLANQFGKALENAELYTHVQNDRIYSRTLLDNLVSGVVAVDREGEITMINREAARIMQFEGRGEKITMEDLPSPVRELLLRTLENGSREQGLEVQFEGGEEGESMDVSLGGAVFSSESGNQIGALAVMHDVTLEKQLEGLIRDQKKSAIVGEIAAHLAHEIRNPLTAVNTFTQLLPERRNDDEFIEKFCGIVRGEVARINDIVSNLLNYAKPKDDCFEVVPVHSVLTSVTDLLLAEFRKSKVTVELNLQADEDEIVGSADYLRQIFINILLNAKEAIEGKKGLVKISTTSNGAAPGNRERLLEVHIEDNGKGISQDLRDRIFDPFFTTKESGTGIGLALTSSLVKKQRGSISVASVDGVGTAFTISFPAAEPDSPLLSHDYR